MDITVNGEPRTVAETASVAELLEALRLAQLEAGVAVCLNGEVVRRADWASTRLQPRDELEIVQATQGG